MGLLTVRYEKGARVYLVGDRVSAEIDRTLRPNGRFPSDHYAVGAEFAWD